MVSFKIGKEKEKGVFRLVTIVGQRKKFPMKNRTSNLKPSALRCFTTEPQRLYGKQFPSRSSYMTCVLHTARISNVVSVMFCT